MELLGILCKLWFFFYEAIGDRGIGHRILPIVFVFLVHISAFKRGFYKINGTVMNKQM